MTCGIYEYDSTAVQTPQRKDWDCSAAATAWMGRSLGWGWAELDVAYEFVRAAIRSGEPARDLRPGRRSGGGMPMHYRLERLVSLGRRTFRLWRRVESGELRSRLGRYRPDAIARAVRRVWGLLLGLPILSD